MNPENDESTLEELTDEDASELAETLSPEEARERLNALLMEEDD